MLPIPKEYLAAACEVRLQNNQLLAIGFVEEIGADSLRVRLRKGGLGSAAAQEPIKVNLFHAGEGFRSVQGRLARWDADEILLEELVVLTQGERRNFFRVEVGAGGKLHLDGDKKGVPVRVENISLGGVLLTCSHPLEKGTKFVLAITLGRVPCRLVCQVRRVLPPQGEEQVTGYGCAFLENGDAQMEQLSGFIFEKQREQLKQTK